MFLNKVVKNAGKMLMYIPYKNRYDIVRSTFINGRLHYCVDDFGAKGSHCVIDDSRYVWDYSNGKYLQYSPSLTKIYNADWFYYYYIYYNMPKSK